jgi:uncharacterized protein (TIGR00251 family)
VVEELFDVSDGDIVVRLHVQPGAGKTVVVGRHGDALKVRVAAPPQEGRANEAVLALVAATFGVERARVELASGQASRAKRVRIGAMDADEAARHLSDALAAGASAPGRKPTGWESQGPRIR